MPVDGPRARFFVGWITRQNHVVVLLASQFDRGIAHKDITKRFYPCSYLSPLQRPLIVTSDLADENFTKLGHAEQRFPEDCVLKEQLEDLGFSPNSIPEEEHHGALGFSYSCPKYYPEIKKERISATGFPCTTCPKNYPEIKKEGLEALGFQFISSHKYITESSKEDLEALGFHCISSPSNVPENKKEHLEALGIHFITSPKNAPGIKKECPELWRFHVATYPKFVPGMARLSPWLHAPGTPPTDEFILYLDSGAGCHVVYQVELLINLRDPPPGLTEVKAADGALLKVSCMGDIKTNKFLIPDVCLVQGLKKNLLSVGQLASTRKISLTFNWDGCEVISYEDGSLVGSAVLQGVNQYVLSFLKIQ